MIDPLAPIAVVGAGVILVSAYLLWRERRTLPQQGELPLRKPTSQDRRPTSPREVSAK